MDEEKTEEKDIIPLNIGSAETILLDKLRLLWKAYDSDLKVSLLVQKDGVLIVSTQTVKEYYNDGDSTEEGKILFHRPGSSIVQARKSSDSRADYLG